MENFLKKDVRGGGNTGFASDTWNIDWEKERYHMNDNFIKQQDAEQTSCGYIGCMESDRTFYKRLGGRVKQLRCNAGLTRRECSAIFNLAEVTLKKYERGERKMPLQVFLMYCRYFNVSADYVLMGRS